MMMQKLTSLLRLDLAIVIIPYKYLQNLYHSQYLFLKSVTTFSGRYIPSDKT